MAARTIGASNLATANCALFRPPVGGLHNLGNAYQEESVLAAVVLGVIIDVR